VGSGQWAVGSGQWAVGRNSSCYWEVARKKTRGSGKKKGNP